MPHADTGFDAAMMSVALSLARQAAARGEVPVGAVVVSGDDIVGRGYNCPISTADPTAHAEIRAMREAAAALHNYRLVGCTLYVTLEPCVMCAGALVNARVSRLVFGATDPKAGAVVSLFEIGRDTRLNHRLIVEGGLLAAESAGLLQAFFGALRARGEK